MLTGKTGLVRKMFDQIRKYRTPSTKCFTKPEHFICCTAVALSGLFLLMKSSRFYETVKKNLRFDMTNAKKNPS